MKTVAIAGMGAIGMDVARALDRGIDGLRLVAVSALNSEEVATAVAGFRSPPAVVGLADLVGADIVLEAMSAAAFDLIAVPVVSESGHLMGVVTVDDVIDVIQEKQTEDVQKMGGMEALDEPYTSIGFWAMIRKRGVWLCLLFIGELLTASAPSPSTGVRSRSIRGWK